MSRAEIRKKISTIFVAMFMLIAAIFAFSGNPVQFAKAEETSEAKKSLDVYVIAGQSNAAGYSTKNNINKEENKKPEYTSGFDRVYYYGSADGNVVNALKSNVRFGCGIAGDRFGAEVGIADVMSASSGNEILIVKYAIGGTYLTDNTTNAAFSVKYGNWCPPSKRQNPTENITGVLYDKWKNTVKSAINAYKVADYAPELKGTFWMQGEAETDGTYGSKDYEGHLRALIQDMRNDYETIFGSDKVKTAPFAIGKIAPTFAGGNGNVDAVRAIQDRVASSTGYTFAIETEDYRLCDENGKPINGIGDTFHFTGDDMMSLGRAVGNVFVEESAPSVEVIVGKNGNANITSAKLDGTPITVKFTPDEHYHLESLTKNGTDVTSDVTNGVYVVNESEGKYVLKATFAEDAKYAVTRIIDKKKGSLRLNPLKSKYYAGTELTVGVEPSDGYKVKAVTFNGVTLTANSDGKYEITVADGENKIEATFEAVNPGGGGEIPDNEKPTDGEKSGCAAANAAYIALAALGLFAIKLKKIR